MNKQCSVCGNEYDKLIKISYNGHTDQFDCFECAIHALAPKCKTCGLSVIGHGVEVDELIFCSAHCARRSGKVGLIDHAPSQVIYAVSEI